VLGTGDRTGRAEKLNVGQCRPRELINLPRRHRGRRSKLGLYRFMGNRSEASSEVGRPSRYCLLYRSQARFHRLG
jgi:hypothetical protein